MKWYSMKTEEVELETEDESIQQVRIFSYLWVELVEGGKQKTEISRVEKTLATKKINVYKAIYQPMLTIGRGIKKESIEQNTRS